MLMPLVLFAALAVQDRAPDPPCVADIRWLHDAQLDVSRTTPGRPLTLFSTVSRGPSCFPATIHLSAAYFDGNDGIVCTGTIALVIPQRAMAQYTNLEIRPGNIYELVRWRNGPHTTTPRWERLDCTSPDGQSGIQPGDIDRATSLRLHATILSGASGVATADLRVTLRP